MWVSLYIWSVFYAKLSIFLSIVDSFENKIEEVGEEIYRNNCKCWNELLRIFVRICSLRKNSTYKGGELQLNV